VIMLSPAETFMAVSNATAAIVERAPAFVTYRVRGTYHLKNDHTLDRTVVVRTEDGVAVVHDADTGKDALRSPFPASPTFDALSSFDISGGWTIGVGSSYHDFDMSVKNVQPLHYAFEKTTADVVSRAVRGYVISFAADSTPALGHLHLERANSMHDDRWLRDIWYDPVTLIPSRIVWGGNDAMDLDARYAVVNDVWLLKSLSLSYVIHAPLWLGRASLSFSGDLSDYAFSTTAPDPRLVPGAAPLPSPSP